MLNTLISNQIVDAVLALHTKEVIHRDLRLDNIFITGGEVVNIGFPFFQIIEKEIRKRGYYLF